MLGKFGRHFRHQFVGYLALFVALGGTAYAAVTITSADVVDETLTGQDVKGKHATSTVAAVNGGLTGADISGQPANAALNQAAVNGSLSTHDIADAAVRAVDLGDNSVTAAKVADNTLTGADIDESTLPGGASSFASHYPFHFALADDYSQVIELRDGTNGRAGGLLTVPFAGRILLSASLQFDMPTEQTEHVGGVACRAEIAASGGPYQPMDGQSTMSVLEARGALGSTVQVPVVASADVSPATYNVRILCRRVTAYGTRVDFWGGTMTALAVGR